MSDIEKVKDSLYHYAVEIAGESFSMEALLRVEAELERLREENELLREELADYKRVEQSEAAKKWPHWIPLFKYDRTLRENERLKAELERLRRENA